jgi:hypothetical protein
VARRTTVAIWLSCLAFAPLSPLHGQAPRWEVDLSGSRIQYDSLAPLNAPSIAGLLEWRRPSFFGRISSGVTGFQDAGWSMQGGADASRWFSPSGAARPAHLEITARGAASRHSSGFYSTLLRSGARFHLAGGSAGAWTGVELAYTRNEADTAAVTGVVPNLGVWARRGPLRATLTYERPEVLEQAYHEARASLLYSGHALDLTLFGGFRDASGSSALANEGWAGASAAWWISSTAALVVSGGRYAPDVLQGLPGGDYISLGFRFTPWRTRPLPETLRHPLIYTETEAHEGGVAFEIDDARTVEIAGDWNDWKLEPLRRDGQGRWRVPDTPGPGVYRFNLRIDGERWIVPEDVPSIDDGFGGEVGLLIISETP